MHTLAARRLELGLAAMQRSPSAHSLSPANTSILTIPHESVQRGNSRIQGIPGLIPNSQFWKFSVGCWVFKRFKVWCLALGHFESVKTQQPTLNPQTWELGIKPHLWIPPQSIIPSSSQNLKCLKRPVYIFEFCEFNLTRQVNVSGIQHFLVQFNQGRGGGHNGPQL